jgi:catechol 2,3-dioxygenase-like lactoylglutathione lyase family enzyme
VRVSRLDHLVITAADLDRTAEFYTRVCGMRRHTFGPQGRTALLFGQQKINLHQAGHELEPCAARPGPGSQDLCFVVDGTPDQVRAHLIECGVEIEQGPVTRTGALGPITSHYVRDPDGNLLEFACYDAAVQNTEDGATGPESAGST